MKIKLLALPIVLGITAILGACQTPEDTTAPLEEEVPMEEPMDNPEALPEEEPGVAPEAPEVPPAE